MSTETKYITEQAYYDYVKSPRGTGDANVLACIAAASRAVDQYCGRRFYTKWETQYFSVNPRSDNYLWMLDLDDMDLADFSNQSGGPGSFEVATEQGNDGTYPTLWTPNVDFIGEPVNQSQAGIIGWPYTSLRAISGKVWPINFVAWQRPTVRIKGNFGWTDFPDAVVQATKIVAALYVKLGDAALGWAGIGSETGPVRVRDIPQATALLAPFRKGTAYGMA